MDRLGLMLEMQRDLQLGYNNGKRVEDFTDTERMAEIRDNTLSMLAEVFEALAETGWKPWAKSNHINRDAFYGEIVDAWHFLMNLMLHTGMTADDLYAGYVRKNQINRARQANGYDGVSEKCPLCKRAYDDPAVECRPINDSFGLMGERAWCETQNTYIGVPS